MMSKMMQNKQSSAWISLQRQWESILYMNLGDELGDFAGFKPGEGFVGKDAKPLPVFGDIDAFLEAGKVSRLHKLPASCVR